MIRFGDIEIENFGVIGEAKLPLSDQGLVLIKGVNHDTNAADSVGSGKSTVFKALSWCLYGQIVRDGKVTDVIRRGTKRAIVTTTFFDDELDEEYAVIRKRTPSQTILTLKTGGKSTTKRKTAETQIKIDEIIGLDWHAFRNSVLYGQNDTGRFADADTTDTERKTVLKTILRLSVFDRALKLTRDELSEAKESVEDAEAATDRLGERFDDALRGLVLQRKRQNTWEREHDEEIEEARAALDVEADDKANRKLAKKLPKLEALETRLVEIVDTLPAVHEAYDTAIEKRDVARAEVDKWKGHLVTVEANHDRLFGQVKTLVHAHLCPTCGANVKKSKSAKAHIRSMMELLDSFEISERVHHQNIERAQVVLAATNAVVNGQQAEMNEIRDYLSKLRDIRERLEVAREASQAAALSDERAKAAQDALEALEEAENPYAEELARLDAQLEGIRVEVIEIGKEEDKAKEVLTPLIFWERAFSNRGLPSLVLDSVVPIIAERANLYLETLADGDITISLSAETELKKGGMKDEICLIADIEGLKDVGPSGGQERKISVAIDLALMDLVAEREGAQLDLLILDEVLDGLDGEGKARVVELLRELRQDRGSIFVISHDAQVQESFERVINVVKEGQVARLEVA